LSVLPQPPHERLQQILPSSDLMPASQKTGDRRQPVSAGDEQVRFAVSMLFAQHCPGPPSRLKQPCSSSPQLPQDVAQQSFRPFA
jgi:hypothetical protein